MTERGNNKVMAYIAVLRPVHWLKNGFVAAPLLFSKKFDDASACVQMLIAVIAFCAASSAIYIWNDLCDRREDEQHPVKKNRPIAGGAVTKQAALILIFLLALVGVGAALRLGGFFLLLTLFYMVINVVYSLGLKHVAILDVMTIAGGFVLRILAGSVAISVDPSHWLVLCTIMFSMFIGFTKRRAELVLVEGAGEHTRKVLQDYSVAFLDQVIPAVTAITIICYALYTVDARTVSIFRTRYMLVTVPSVMYGMLRYIYLIYHKHRGEDPTDLLRRDIPTIINLILWVVLSILVVTKGHELDLF